MSPEEGAEVASWLQRASLDLRAADLDLGAAPPLIEDALFHCQQAAEKAMKAFLTANGRIFRRTHDLDELAAACEALDAGLRPALDPARDLTVFAWEFRYPGESETPSLAEAQEAFRVAERTVKALAERSPSALRD